MAEGNGANRNNPDHIEGDEGRGTFRVTVEGTSEELVRALRELIEIMDEVRELGADDLERREQEERLKKEGLTQ